MSVSQTWTLPATIGVVCRIVCACACVLAACSGTAKGPEVAANQKDPHMSSAMVSPHGSSPMHARWHAGACEVDLRDAVGSTYRFDESAADAVASSLKQAVSRCLTSKTATSGTAYLQAKVAASGVLTDVTVSPGGALSSQVAQCFAESLRETRVVAPMVADSVLVVFLVCECEDARDR